MMVPMTRVRVLGPRERFDDALGVLQDFGMLHPVPVEVKGVEAGGPPLLAPARTSAREEREACYLRRGLQDIERGAAIIDLPAFRRARAPERASRRDLARALRIARRVRRAAEALARRRTALEEERALLLKYRDFFAVFEPLLRAESSVVDAVPYYLILRSADEAVAGRLRAALAAVVGQRFELRTRLLPTGEMAILALVPGAARGRIESALASAGVEEVPVPPSFAGLFVGEAARRVLERPDEIEGELADIREALRRLAHADGPDLVRARALIADRLAQLEALAKASATPHAFVIEGWVPASARPELAERLEARLGETVVCEDVATERWRAEGAPVILSNPRLFRPFEMIVRAAPLPRYGTIDPTPFVGIFFPMFFGIMLGDLGYAALLAILALVLRQRSRTLAEIAGACAAFAAIFGVLFGEIFGDLGRRLFGLEPLLFGREEALLPFLGLTLALGFVHVVLGLVLGAIGAARHEPRHAVGKGVAAAMMVLTLLALLAAVRVLPEGFFTPAVVLLLAAFPILVIAEGIIAPLELLAALGNVLSYARIMALGTASVMMAIVANRMIGGMGSVVVGALFALLFHLVNFGLGLFSPTVHALRLHFVEFFGKFVSPGGVEYRPLRRFGTA